MAGIPATFGGYPFDPEVYGSFIDQEPTFTDNIIASQVVATDQSMATLLDNGGTVGTIRFYNPPDPEADPPLARDGDTDNTPVETAGGKQSWIRIDRMKAWKDKQLTREITAAEPMQYLARTVGAYWRNYWQSLMIKIAGTVTSLSGLSSHVITATNGVRTFYVRITTPSGDVLGGGGTFDYENRTLECSMKKSVEYTGEETPVTMYRQVGEFLSKGTYTVSIFADGNMIGSRNFTFSK